MAGILYLLPATLGNTPVEMVIPLHNIEIIRGLKWFIVEELRTARRFIKKAAPDAVIDELQFIVFNEHTKEETLPDCIQPLIAGNDVGLLSEAGLPCVADPGSMIVKAAHFQKIVVKPLSGPSSIMLALMASGMNGQQFVFHGYLPVDKTLRIKKLKELEQSVSASEQTQIFIETPYRNLQVFEAILQSCSNHLLLAVVTDLTTSEEFIKVMTIREWKKNIPDINKKPTVFLLNR